MTPDELRAEIETGAIDTVVLAFPDHYGRLMGKRLTGRFFLDAGMADGTHACDYLFTVDMEMEPVEGYDYANWNRGYGDFHMVPDLTTIRRCGWTDGVCEVQGQALYYWREENHFQRCRWGRGGEGRRRPNITNAAATTTSSTTSSRSSVVVSVPSPVPSSVPW